MWKRLTKGKHLWLRNNLSTITSQTISSVLFFTIAFYGVYDIWPIIIETTIAKCIISIIDTPFIYLSRALFRGTDYGTKIKRIFSRPYQG